MLLVASAIVADVSVAEEPLKGLADKYKDDETVLGDFARIYNQFDLMSANDPNGEESYVDDTQNVVYNVDGVYDPNFVVNTDTTLEKSFTPVFACDRPHETAPDINSNSGEANPPF